MWSPSGWFRRAEWRRRRDADDLPQRDARGLLGPEHLVVAVPDLETHHVHRRRVHAAAVGSPRVDRVPGAFDLTVVRVAALPVDDVGLERLLPRLPRLAADLEHRERAVVPVAE